MKALYKIGDIIMIKGNSTIFYQNIWSSQVYPYAKVYDVRDKYDSSGYLIGYEYHIGSEDKFNHEYWGECRFVDFYENDEIFHHMSDKVQDHFYSNKELRKMKLDKLYQK